MNNIETYNHAFCEALSLDKSEIHEELAFNSIPTWDSVGQMMLVACIEGAFGIELQPDHIVGFNSYKKGKQILREYYHIDF